MPEPQPKKGISNSQVMIFTIILSFVCAIILASMASALKEPQEVAKELDRSQQMMIAARIFTYEGYFLMEDEKGEKIPAKNGGDGFLVKGSENDIATQKDILEVYKKRFKPLLVNDKGELTTFEKAGINYDEYLADFKKTGYYKQPYKLIYEIMPNTKEEKDQKPIGYVVPVNGYGLWDAIYGYIALKTDGDTVIGISWYDQKETPGLGANISEAPWQNLFPGKKIFQPNTDGSTDLKTAPVGIVVVKGRVSEVLGESQKAKTAVDGMPGATLTGNGVTSAYQEVLSAYRPFFIKIHQSEGGKKDAKA